MPNPTLPTKYGEPNNLPRYADCIFLYPHSPSLTAASLSATTEEKTTLAARSVQRYLDRTPTDAVRCLPLWNQWYVYHCRQQ